MVSYTSTEGSSKTAWMIGTRGMMEKMGLAEEGWGMGEDWRQKIVGQI